MADCISGLLGENLNYRFRDLKDELMSVLSDKIAEVKASQDEAIDRVQSDVADLQAQIDDLRKRVTLPEDIAELDAIAAKNRALDPVQPETLPEG